MGLFDVDGFGEREELEPVKIKKKEDVFVENSFDRGITEDVPILLKIEVINSHYNMGSLLRKLGYFTGSSTMYCPFHNDSLTGKPSAKYHEDTDKLYCFSENKMYSAYHVIKILYGINPDKVFNDIWYKMSNLERNELLDKYSDESSKEITTKEQSEWDKYNESVLSYFKNGKVTYTQYKNALFKVLDILGFSS